LRISALIFGILAGLLGLPLAILSSALDFHGPLVYLVPIASLVGGGIALNQPAAAGILLLLSAVFWLWLGFGINGVTIGPVALNVIGGVLALVAEGQRRAQWRPFGRGRGTVGGVPGASPDDQARWRALVEYDADIARAEATLRPYGQKYVDQFAAGYLALNDKAYIASILAKVTETARRDAKRDIDPKTT
jgi:hypothetical protein